MRRCRSACAGTTFAIGYGAGHQVMRKLSIATALVTAFVLTANGGNAQEFPARAVRLVVPYPAGGGTGILARVLADQLARKWGQSLIVENIGGAAGNIGSAEVARAAPDGHTLLVTAPGPIATNSFLYKDMPYDPSRWVPIALLTTGPYVLALRKTFEGSTVRDLIERAKANPGKLTAAIPAAGSPERVRDLPEVPTISEAGLPGYRSVTWYAMVGPPQTPAALAEKINRDVVEILRRQDIIDRVRAIQMEPVKSTRAEAAKFF